MIPTVIVRESSQEIVGTQILAACDTTIFRVGRSNSNQRIKLEFDSSHLVRIS